MSNLKHINLSPQPAEKKDLHINAIYEGMAENGGFLANGLENNPRNTALYSDIGKPSNAQIKLPLIGAFIGFIALTGCDGRPSTAEWQNVCAESHLQMTMVPTSHYNPATKSSTVTMQQRWLPVCDKWELECVSGRDGTTICAP